MIHLHTCRPLIVDFLVEKKKNQKMETTEQPPMDDQGAAEAGAADRVRVHSEKLFLDLMGSAEWVAPPPDTGANEVCAVV